jgi:hypothetical protein
MKSVCVSVLVWLAAQALPVGAADAGIYTIVEGNTRVLRGVSWVRPVPGVRMQDADVLDVPDGSVTQVEMTRGGTLNLAGPASAFAGSQSGDGKSSPASEWVILRGWVKAAGDAAGLRLRLPQGTVDLVDAIIVVKADPDSMQMFVESGTAKVAASGVKTPPREAHAGEWWSKTGDKPFTVDTRAQPSVVASMPRVFMDPLPRLRARYGGPAPALKAGTVITYAEAEPWLAGPYRAQFMRRLQSRLSDPTFRAGAEGRAAAYPDWDRMLHPERYQ